MPKVTRLTNVSITGDDVGDEVSAHQSIIDSISSNSPQKDIIEEIDVSASLGKNEKSVMLSISDVPDISAENAQQIVEMFAQELSESISGMQSGINKETWQDIFRLYR